MKTIPIQRPSPPYRSVVAIKELAYFYDYPKNSEGFIWDIPGRYTEFKDREVSALCCSWIFDGTTKSVEAAQRLDKVFNGKPHEFITQKKYNYFIMDIDQERTFYEGILIRDCYYFFKWLDEFLTRYQSFKAAFESHPKETPYDTAAPFFKDVRNFRVKTIEAEGRLNLFLLMMTHLFDDYDFDGHLLRPPLFSRVIIPNFKHLGIIKKGDKRSQWTEIARQHLLWFSEDNPMTYWIAVAAYNKFRNQEPRKYKRFSSMKITRHRLRKK